MRVSGTLELELYGSYGCELLCRWWDLNASPLKEHPELLITELSLPPLSFY